MSYNIKHPFQPVFDNNSKILILGSFPSIKSRDDGFYYGNPQNRFWKLMALFFNNEKLPENTADKKKLLLSNGIALFDVIQSCTIEGSKDNSIKNVIPNDLNIILKNSNIQTIYAKSSMAYNLYLKYCKDKTNLDIIKLPSTSSANASYNFEKLKYSWKVILNDN